LRPRRFWPADCSGNLEDGSRCLWPRTRWLTRCRFVPLSLCVPLALPSRSSPLRPWVPLVPWPEMVKAEARHKDKGPRETKDANNDHAPAPFDGDRPSRPALRPAGVHRVRLEALDYPPDARRPSADPAAGDEPGPEHHITGGIGSRQSAALPCAKKKQKVRPMPASLFACGASTAPTTSPRSSQHFIDARNCSTRPTPTSGSDFHDVFDFHEALSRATRSASTSSSMTDATGRAVMGSHVCGLGVALTLSPAGRLAGRPGVHPAPRDDPVATPSSGNPRSTSWPTRGPTPEVMPGRP